MSRNRRTLPPLVLCAAAAALALPGGCSNPRTPLGIAREEAAAEQGYTPDNEKDRVYLRRTAEELARKTKGVESVKGIVLSWDSPNRVTAMADVQTDSGPRVLTFAFVRFWPTPDPSGGRGQPVPYWREMSQDAAPGEAPP